jgi:hypothetical protein
MLKPRIPRGLFMVFGVAVVANTSLFNPRLDKERDLHPDSANPMLSCIFFSPYALIKSGDTHLKDGNDVFSV